MATRAALAEPPAPWWERVPQDYHRRPVGTEIDRRYPLTTAFSAGLDMLTCTGLGATVGSLLAANMMMPGQNFARELAKLDLYATLAANGDVAASFQAPPARVPVIETSTVFFGFQPFSIRTSLLSFDSPFEPVDKTIRGPYARMGGGGRAYAQYWSHRGGARKTLIFVHGFIADPYWFNARMFGLRKLYKQGYDILLVTLPFHGYRKAWFEPFSGFGYFSRGMGHINEAMLQAVLDLRIFVDYLLKRGAPHVGIAGYSLGGYMSAIMAAVEPRLSFAIPMCPVVSVVDAAMDWPSTRLLFGQFLRLTGLDLPDLRQATAVHSPLTYGPALPADRRLIMSASGDRLTTPRQIGLLRDHWAGSEMYWFPGNHLMHFERAKYQEHMRQFMDRCTG
jgi:pimeloyl-ACP methyl ester carboxylesterase